MPFHAPPFVPVRPPVRVASWTSRDIAEALDPEGDRGGALALADGVVTEPEWRRLTPDIPEGIASWASRAVLEMFASPDRFVFDGPVRDRALGFLRTRGYPVTEPLPGGPDLAARIASQNISEPDLELHRLARVVGRPEELVTVGVVDKPVSTWHPALVLHQPHRPQRHRSPGDPHGSMVFGIATRGSERIRGVFTYDFDLTAAIAQGARVVNVSFLETDVAGFLAVVDAHPEVLFVKSAGNEGVEVGQGAYAAERYVPANVRPNLITVANADQDGTRHETSNYGAPITIAAHGHGLFSADSTQSYFAGGGTSAAAANISNVAAKCLLLDPGLTPAELKTLLVDTAERSPSWAGLVAAGGLVDPVAAMRAAAAGGLVRSGLELDVAWARVGGRPGG